jgi:hypothetical protein
MLLSNDKSTVMDVSNLSSGTYWVRLSSDSEIQTRQFVKK